MNCFIIWYYIFCAPLFRWFVRCNDTVLGETVDDARELVIIEECDDALLSGVVQVVSIKQVVPDPDEWKAQGGLDDPASFNKEEDHTGTSFWYRYLYQHRFGRFEDPPAVPEVIENEKGCACCDRLAAINRREYPQLGPKIDQSQSTYQNVEWHGMDLRPGDAVFMDPDAYVLRGPDGQIIKKEKVDVGTEEQPEEFDEDMYPEKYRKTDTIKGSNQDTPDPFCIGYIVAINYSGIIRLSFYISDSF